MRETIESNIPWIGHIPKEWKISKYKYFSTSRMGETILSGDTSESGIPIYSATQDDGVFGYIQNPKLILNKGDFVIPARGNSIGFVKIVESETATCTQTTICSKNIKNISSKFLFYCCKGFKNIWFKYEGSAIPQITVNQIENNILPLPPKKEQNAIVKYLDEKCTKIDEAISRNNQIIEKLEEYRKAVITQAVTKGLNPDVEMKDSGYEYVGYIPASWNTKRIKFLATINNGKEVKTEEGTIPVYGSGGVFKYTDKPLYCGESILMGRKGTIDKPLLVDGEFWTVDTMFYMSNFRNINIKYLYYCCKEVINYEYYMSGSVLPSMTQTDIGNISLPYPSLKEQGQIVSYLDKRCLQIDESIQKQKDIVSKLEEYKKSLIYNAVTGKIEV